MTVELAVAILVGFAAIVDDLWRRQVSNWIPLAALAGGIVCQVIQHGVWGIAYALLGALCGFAVFLIFYWLGGMGGGDVKLMAGFGALLGTARLAEAAVWTALLGGLLAAVVVVYGALCKCVSSSREKAIARSIPYAPAIAAGTWLAILTK
jgi:prepilin peptidase CpaA